MIETVRNTLMGGFPREAEGIQDPLTFSCSRKVTSTTVKDLNGYDIS